MRAADYEIKNLDKLDRILVKLCSMVVDGQRLDSELFGVVAAAVLDPENNIVARLNYLNKESDHRVHAERAAIEAYQEKHGEIPEGSIIITTCSPCSEHMEERDGPSCTDLVNHSTVHKVYCGYRDPTQDEDQRIFTLQETNNPQIRELCEMFASTFLSHKEVDEMDRRGFLGALGAGAMAAAGVPAQAASRKSEPMAFLSSHMEAEEMLHKTALRAGMRGLELAQFLAQCYHESAGFGRMHEYASGAEYEGRRDLGNVNRGDGVKYKGRGFIQITGRDNYRRAGQALGLPLEQQPELASRPDVAAKIAVWYWNNRVKPNVDNFNDTTSVTRFINPKMRGLEDRHENFKDYKNMFNMAKL